MTAQVAATPSEKSLAGSTRMGSPRPAARPCGPPRASPACCATRRTWGGSTTTRPRPPPIPAPVAAPASDPGPKTNGSPSRSQRLSAKRSSKQPNKSAAATPTSAHGAPLPACSCCEGWCDAATVEPWWPATSGPRTPAIPTANGTATTTAATTTPSAPAAKTAAAQNGPFEPTPWTVSSTNRSATRYYAPTFSSPANTPSPPPPLHLMTTSSTNN